MLLLRGTRETSFATMTPGTSRSSYWQHLLTPTMSMTAIFASLADNKHVKYVTTEHRSSHLWPRGTLRIALLPAVPGEWTTGRVANDDHTGKSCLAPTTTAKLPVVQSVWHPTMIDYLRLEKLNRLRQSIHKAHHSLFGDEFMIINLTALPWSLRQGQLGLVFQRTYSKAAEWSGS